MERLTKRLINGTAYTGHVINTLIMGVNYPAYIGKAVDKLANYEDVEEQRLLIRLPCKVGDTLYFIHDKRVIASEVLSLKYHVEAENHGIFIRERLTIDVEGNSVEIDFCEIGKTVFLKEAEAEAKLKEMSYFQTGNN